MLYGFDLNAKHCMSWNEKSQRATHNDWAGKGCVERWHLAWQCNYVARDIYCEWSLEIFTQTLTKTFLSFKMFVVVNFHFIPLAVRTNHALLKPTAMSNATDTGPSSYAVDGDQVTSAESHNTGESYWTVDLQYDLWVTSLAFTNSDNICKCTSSAENCFLSSYGLQTYIFVMISCNIINKDFLQKHKKWASNEQRICPHAPQYSVFFNKKHHSSLQRHVDISRVRSSNKIQSIG